MKVRFLTDVIIQNKFKVNKGDILTAKEYDEDSFVITLKNMRKTIAPKSSLGDVFEIAEE
jgi:hypothetical protein